MSVIDLGKGLEPDAVFLPSHPQGHLMAFLMSIAISGKRIADALSTPAQTYDPLKPLTPDKTILAEMVLEDAGQQSAPHETEYSKCKVICDCDALSECPQGNPVNAGMRGQRCQIWIERRKLFQSKG